jgi:deazaflavin-dependent oxidoreductase (nitroreductase family)
MKVTVQLATTGRRTGHAREVTLYAFEDGDRLVVVGSVGGAARDPAWVHNLRAEPRARVTRGAVAHEVQAVEAEGAERDRLWTLVTKAFPLYTTYQARTRRRIPIFVLEPEPDVR